MSTVTLREALDEVLQAAEVASTAMEELVDDVRLYRSGRKFEEDLDTQTADKAQRVLEGKIESARRVLREHDLQELALTRRRAAGLTNRVSNPYDLSAVRRGAPSAKGGAR